MGMTVAFTGHRPDKLGGYGQNPVQYWVRTELKKLLKKLSPSRAISGMAIGVDQWAAEECVALNIPFVAAVPFAGQEAIWPPTVQYEYRRLLEQAAEVVTISKGGYAAWKMHERNYWMVDHCDLLIAVWDGSDGGTAACVRYALQRKRKIERIDPTEAWE